MSYDDYIFWQRAQTSNTWTELFAQLLIENIQNPETYHLLSILAASFQYNNEFSSFLLPYVFLHFYQTHLIKKEVEEAVKREFQLIFDVIKDEKRFKRVQNLEEFKYKFLADHYYIVQTKPSVKKSEIVQSPNEFLNSAKQIAKLLFEVMDFLTRYQYKSKDENRHIKSLLNKFSLKTLAQVSYNCGDYQRALIQYESYLTTLSDDERENEYAFLVHIYAKLGDFDSIAGVADKRKYPWSAIDKMFIGNITGNWEDHMVCIEEIMREPENISLEAIASTVNCLVAHNNCEQAIVVADKMLATLYSSCKDELNRYEDVKSTALLRLSRFDELEKVIDLENGIDTSNWGSIEAKLLLKLRAHDGFHDEITQVRLSLMENFKFFESNQSNYRINYDSIVRLHMLTDFDKAYSVIQQIKNANGNEKEIIKSFFDEIRARKKFFKLSPMQSESILALHRTLFKEIRHAVDIKIPENSNDLFKIIDLEIGQTWLDCAIVYQNQHDQANAFLLEAAKYKTPGLFVQKAKLLWRKNRNPAQATKILQFHCDELEKKVNFKNNPFYAKGLLLIARYNGDAAAVDFQTNKSMYKKALTANVDRDKAFLHYAEYLDRAVFLSAEKEPDVNTIETEKIQEILELYGSGLLYSTEYVFQALPRFLQIWFDATVPKITHHQRDMLKRKSTGVSSHNYQLNAVVKKFVAQLKPFQFYTAYSQLVSRICHPCPEVYIILKGIISKLFDLYPRLSLWFVVHALKSKLDLASDRMREILERVPKHAQILSEFESYIDGMMLVARVQEKEGSEKLVENINSCLSKIGTRILMPLQQNLQILNETVMNNLTDEDQIFIHRMDEKITILKSMQKPKKVSFSASNGQNYALMVKSKDDLRIDFRFMEFCKVLNDYFRKDREASQRYFSIRTYAVAPINEEVGIIEWLQNMETLKNVIYSQYERYKRLINE